MFNIPEDEIQETFSRSGGKGGQNVNKVNTRVQLKWNIYKTKIFIFEELAQICYELKKRISNNGEIVVTCSSERSQAENRRIARKRLHKLVNDALEPKAERQATKPTRGSVEKRISGKKRQSEKKKNRKIKLE